MAKDYYQILGVSKSATQDELKSAFKKLAHKHHPDKAGGNVEKFKEINEAYQILGDEQKRKQYDQYGTTFDASGFQGQHGVSWEDFIRQASSGGGNSGFSWNGNVGDIGDIFEGIFSGFSGGGRTRTRSRTHRGQDIEMELSISFQEAAFGGERDIELYKTVSCDRCSGKGAEPGSKIKTCDQCKGSGIVQGVSQSFFGMVRTEGICPTCHGEGSSHDQSCRDCHGKGALKKNDRLKVKIPAGIDHGQTIRFTGRGEAAERNGTAGDLYVAFRVEPDKRFKREGDNVYSKLEVSFPQAALGTIADIETLDGKKSLKIPAGVQSGRLIRIRDAGMTKLGTISRGDQFVEVVVKTPTKLSRKQKKFLQDFEGDKKDSWF